VIARFAFVALLLLGCVAGLAVAPALVPPTLAESGPSPIDACVAATPASGLAPLQLPDPRVVAPVPGDFGPEWDPYTEDATVLDRGIYMATYRLHNPREDGLLLSFEVLVQASEHDAVWEYCRSWSLSPGHTDLSIGDSAYLDAEGTPAFGAPPISECPYDEGGGSVFGRVRIRNVLFTLALYQSAAHAMCGTEYVLTAMETFAARVRQLETQP
jgi:hypothetical protein